MATCISDRIAMEHVMQTKSRAGMSYRAHRRWIGYNHQQNRCEGQFWRFRPRENVCLEIGTSTCAFLNRQTRRYECVAIFQGHQDVSTQDAFKIFGSGLGCPNEVEFKKLVLELTGRYETCMKIIHIASIQYIRDGLPLDAVFPDYPQHPQNPMVLSREQVSLLWKAAR